jgi:hypothetical protein
MSLGASTRARHGDGAIQAVIQVPIQVLAA